MELDFRKTRFIISAPNLEHLDKYLPNSQTSGFEIAFAGRSNAGKSSALNALTDQKSLAKTSKTPGRTQLINVFEVADTCRIIDLPGYGFAKVPLKVKETWQKALGEYLQYRKSLIGLVVLMDIRHPLKDLDRQMIEWASTSELKVLVILTKTDKLNQRDKNLTLNSVRAELKDMPVCVEPLSSIKGTGKIEILKVLTSWFEDAHNA